ncbi:MAG: hypothetical protein ABI210_03000 [Abditibacteriaceae bacterium]
MSFPLDYCKEILWDKQTELNPQQFQESFISALRGELAKAEAQKILVHDNKILFNTRLFRINNFYNYRHHRMLAGITLGIVEIDSADSGYRISYHLNFKRMFIASCFGTLFYVLFIFSALIIADTHDKPSLYLIIFFILIAPIQYTCIGIPNAVLNFRALLKRVLKNM